MHRRFDNFIRILLQTAFTVHGWSHEWELKKITFGEGTRVLRVLAVFREYMLRALEISTGSTLLILLSTLTILDVCTAGTACCTRGSVLLIILPVLAVFGPSVLALLILPARAVFRTPHTRVLQYTQHQQYPEYRNPQYRQHRQPQKKVSNTIHTNMYHAAAAACTVTPTHSSTNSSIWSTAVVLLLGMK